MITTCSRCREEYDDLYRSTLCPHEPFKMHTLAVRGDGQEKICTSVEELNEFMAGGRRP